jgi:hypothetical protein
MKKCYDETTIQAFLDGEVAPVLAENIVCHITTCETCLMLVEAVEQENSFVFETLNNEFNVAVPTDKIWQNINTEINETKLSRWQKLFRFNMLQDPALMFAGVFLIIATAFGVYLNFKAEEIKTSDVASNIQPKQPEVKQVEPNPIPTETSKKVEPSLPRIETVSNQNKPKRAIEQPKFVIEKAVERSEVEVHSPKFKVEIPKNKDQKTKSDTPQFIEGEETYIKTISTLSKNVEGDRLISVKPSARINYEKNLAIVNDAIKKMRKQVRKNPKDETAKEILFTSYQNKIDLINSLNEKNEMIAAIR